MNERGLTGAGRVAAVLALAVLALAGCGDEGATPRADSSSAQQSPQQSAQPSASSGAPECEGIWKGGDELPRSYDGCNSDAGFVASDKLGCSSGQRIVRYGDHFYAVPGGTIHETESSLEDDRGYRDVVASCRA